MKILCPKCRTLIPASQLNAAADVAVCERCNETFAISSVVHAGRGGDAFDILSPPRGAWFDDLSDGWRVGATTRSPIAFFLVPFACVWCGGAIGGIYGSQILNGEFNLFLSLFGIPFLIAALGLISACAMAIFGKLVLTVQDGVGSVFTGVGSIGWTRRFDWRAVSQVKEEPLGYNRGTGISLIGATRLNVGSILTDGRRYYLLRVLQKKLAESTAMY